MCSVVIHTLGHTDKGNNHNGLCCANGETRGYGPLLDATTHPEEDLILSQKDSCCSLSWNLLLSEVYLQPSPPESMEKVLMDYSINGCVMFNKLQNTTRPRRRPRSFSKVKYVIYLLLLLGFWFLLNFCLSQRLAVTHESFWLDLVTLDTDSEASESAMVNIHTHIGKV